MNVSSAAGLAVGRTRRQRHREEPERVLAVNSAGTSATVSPAVTVTVGSSGKDRSVRGYELGHNAIGADRELDAATAPRAQERQRNAAAARSLAGRLQ